MTGSDSVHTQKVSFHHSIAFKLSVLTAMVIVSAVAALSLFSASQSLERESQNYRALVASAASSYAATVADSVAVQDKHATLSALRGIRELPSVTQADIRLPSGEVFVELGTGAWLISEQPEQQSLWSANSMRIELPIVKGGERVGTLGMLADLTPIRSEIVDNLVFAITISLLIGALGVVAARWFVLRVTAPLRSLTSVMVNVRDGQPMPTIELRSNRDETGLLTRVFDQMMQSIEARDKQIAEHMETLEATVEERTFDLRQARDDAEAANAAKSDFLATMSHEIRTPMNGMMVMAEMLGAADLAPRHRRYAEIIRRSGNGLLTIINDILDLSKIEAGHLELELIEVSPEELITDVASLFWERARSKSLELATYVSPDVPEQILADPTRLNQVVSNLVNNALKFTETGGVLVRLDAKMRNDQTCMLSIQVVDTGIGIPEDRIDKVFESFSQADQSTTRQFGGTGLGLTVCQRLVDAMDGKIGVKSKLGKGSVFSVLVPVSVLSAPPIFTAQSLRVGVGLTPGPTRFALEKTLMQFGCEITDNGSDVWITTSSGALSDDLPTVVLTDIGDTRADQMLADAEAVDILALPYQRKEVSDLLTRAAHNEYRGTNAIEHVGERSELKSFHGLRVLAADDNAVNREVLREALSTLKVESVFVEDGAQAVEAVKSSSFGLILMDGSMPVMDGFEATRHIRRVEQQQGRKATPIFALTAQVAGSGQGAWNESGANGLILKPFTLEKLIQTFEGVAAPSEPTNVLLQERPGYSLLDASTIRSLDELGDEPGRVREKIWKMFREKAPETLRQIHQVMDDRRTDEVAKKAHAFKSMALSAGLAGLADALQKIEHRAINDSDSPLAQSNMNEVQILLQKSFAEMSDYSTRTG